MIVLVLLGCYDKNSIDNKHSFLTVLDTGKSKIKAQVSDEGLLVNFLLCPCGGRGKGALWAVSYKKGTNPIHEGANVISLPPSTGLPPNRISLDVRISTDEFLGVHRHLVHNNDGVSQGNLKVH